MEYVELYKLNNDGTQNTIAVCRLNESGIVTCEGAEILIKNLERNGIKNYSATDEQKLFFKDGLRFLEQLKFNFNSGYLNASDVKTN